MQLTLRGEGVSHRRASHAIQKTMNKRIDTIIREARKLTSKEQAELLARLPLELGTEVGIGGHSEAEVTELALDRAAEVDRGEVELVPWEKVLADLAKC